MHNPRQTQSYLRNLFAERGISPRHQLGQNFLIDLNIHDLIIRESHIDPTDVVLEVGCGTGALTARLVQSAAAVVAVELDARLAALAQFSLQNPPNLRIIESDILQRKHVLNPLVIDALQSALAVSPQRQLKLIANLPYAIATPLISNLLVHPSLQLNRAVVTIQREVADRILAPPLSPHYGALSVLVQSLAQVELIRTLPPSVFWPKPKVESAIIRITPATTLRDKIPNLPWFHLVVRQIFLHRRKNLRGAILAAWGQTLDKPTVDHLLDSLDLETQVRPEALNVDEFIDLASALSHTPAQTQRP